MLSPLARLAANVFAFALVLACATPALAFVGMTTPRLKAEGRHLVDPSGKRIVLHGWMQPAASWFNGYGRNYANPRDFTSDTSVADQNAHLRKVADILSNPAPQLGREHGWYCSFVRFIGDNGGVSNFAPGWDVNGNLANPAQFNGWIDKTLVPYVEYCRSVGLYVVICGNPSVAYPDGNVNRNMTAQYQTNLVNFWTAIASRPAIKAADNVMFEICNEPITIETSFGSGVWGSGSNIYWSALARFMQPVVDAIRNAGCDQMVWIPGLGWQGQYQGFPAYPITGTNIGYAAHIYPAYGSCHDNTALVEKLWASNYKAAADFRPMIVTELMWEPNDGTGYQNLWNASTEGFGLAIKGCMERQGNVSYLVGMTMDVLGNVEKGMANATLPTVQGAQAAFAWFTTYTDTLPPMAKAQAPSRLVNISSRSNVATDASLQVAGFIIEGTANKRVLIRACGAPLAPYGIPDFLENPFLTLFDKDEQVIATNDTWDAQTILSIAKDVGAFDWADGTRDAALLINLAPGAYTAQVAPRECANGVGLIEVYDADGDTSESRLVNISTRSDAKTGTQVQVAGFVVKGEAPLRVLIRGGGPGLDQFKVPGTLADPTITLFDVKGMPLLVNDDWDETSIKPAAEACKAYAWSKGSKDSALVVTLIPGTYTAQVKGKAGTTGIALVEVYEAK